MPRLKTLRFGDVDYRDEDVIHLPAGLVGLPELRNWVMLDMGEGMPLKWFQSLDRADFGFPVTRPEFFHDGYAVPMAESVAKSLGNNNMDDLATLVIATVHAGGDKVTGNLMAPLVVAADTRRGAQVTIDDGTYGVREEINYFKFGLAVGAENAENAVGEHDSDAERAPDEEKIPELTGV
jgi:flagellar assembly factor FliW